MDRRTQRVPRSVLLREAEAEPGGEHNIVALPALDRVAEEAIAGGDLPPQPFLEERVAAEVEVEAVGSGIGQIGEKPHCLGDAGVLGYLVVRSEEHTSELQSPM